MVVSVWTPTGGVTCALLFKTTLQYCVLPIARGQWTVMRRAGAPPFFPSVF